MIDQLVDKIILLLACVMVLVILGVVLYLSTKFKTKLGVNTSKLTCPECGLAAPATRAPRNRREMLWGGFTCEKCETEVDKWGRKIK